MYSELVSTVQYSDCESFYYSEAVCASSSLCSCQHSTATNRTFPLQQDFMLLIFAFARWCVYTLKRQALLAAINMVLHLPWSDYQRTIGRSKPQSITCQCYQTIAVTAIKDYLYNVKQVCYNALCVFCSVLI